MTTNPNEVTEQEVEAACKAAYIYCGVSQKADMRKALEQFAQSRSATSDAAGRQPDHPAAHIKTEQD